MPTFLLIGTPILFCLLTYLVWKYISELLFYRSQNFDYSVPNPKGAKMYYGRYAAADDSNLMSNYARIWWGYPLFLFVTGVIFLGFFYSIYAIQSCPFADIKKCGIEVKGNKVSISAPPSQ